MKYIALIICVLMAGCGTASKAYRVMDPRDINKRTLSDLEPSYTSKYRLPYVKTSGVDQSNEWWSGYIDNQFSEYGSCVKKKFRKDPDLKKLRDIKVVIVKDSKFECKYHGGRCSGEYDSSLGVIIVARKDFDKEGFVPLLKHEWSHANGILKSDHSNHEYVKRCTRY